MANTELSMLCHALAGTLSCITEDDTGFAHWPVNLLAASSKALYIGSNIGEKSDHSLPVTYSILQPPVMISTGKEIKETTSRPLESMSPAPRKGA